jgi:hypothetical protein
MKFFFLIFEKNLFFLTNLTDIFNTFSPLGGNLIQLFFFVTDAAAK